MKQFYIYFMGALFALSMATVSRADLGLLGAPITPVPSPTPPPKDTSIIPSSSSPKKLNKSLPEGKTEEYNVDRSGHIAEDNGPKRFKMTVMKIHGKVFISVQSYNSNGNTVSATGEIIAIGQN